MRKFHWLGVLGWMLVSGAAQAQEDTAAGAEKGAGAAEPKATEAAAAPTEGKPAEPTGAAKEKTEAGASDKPPAGTSEALDDAEAKAKKDSAYGHGRQFGVRAGIVGGYRMVFRYDSSPLCRDFDTKKSLKDQQKFCGHPSPLAAEVAVSFAPIDSIEPFLFGRFGLGREKQTDTDNVLMVGAGLRVYTMSDSAFKVFIEPAVGAELEGDSGKPQTTDPAYKPEHKKDVVFHLAAGPQYDFAKMIGVYLDAGITTGILRSIHSNLELQLGLQFRAP